MFVGTHRHIIDSKNRLAIPVKYRAELDDKFIISESLDDCLTIHPMDEWNKYNARINDLPYAEAFEMKRFVNATATSVEPDSQGRALLTADLMEAAGLEKNVVIVGCGEYAEIWDEAVYDARFGRKTKEQKQAMLKKMLEAGV